MNRPMNRPMNRRHFLKTLIAGVVAMACLRVAQAEQAPSAAESLPDIVILIADDMGYSDLGCYGGEIATPNLDGLARRGIRFTQYYTENMCAPTRVRQLEALWLAWNASGKARGRK